MSCQHENLPYAVGVGELAGPCAKCGEWVCWVSSADYHMLGIKYVAVLQRAREMGQLGQWKDASDPALVSFVRRKLAEVRDEGLGVPLKDSVFLADAVKEARIHIKTGSELRGWLKQEMAWNEGA